MNCFIKMKANYQKCNAMIVDNLLRTNCTISLVSLSYFTIIAYANVYKVKFTVYSLTGGHIVDHT